MVKTDASAQDAPLIPPGAPLVRESASSGWSVGTLLLFLLGGALAFWGVMARLAWLVFKVTHQGAP
jgi:TRAP-type C4-dicarboxylate transport system permease large subunit